MCIFHKFSNWKESKIVYFEHEYGHLIMFRNTYEQKIQTKTCMKCGFIKQKEIGDAIIIKSTLLGSYGHS